MFDRILPLAATLGVAGFLAASTAIAQTEDQPAVTDPAQFAAEAASGNLFEIESSRLAVERIAEGDLATFAQQMIDEHQAAGDALAAAAQEEGVTVPAEMNETHASQLDALTQTEEPAAFAAGYYTAQSLAHGEAIELFRSYAANGPDGALRVFAGETLPTLEAHAEMLAALNPEGAATGAPAAPAEVTAPADTSAPAGDTTAPEDEPVANEGESATQGEGGGTGGTGETTPEAPDGSGGEGGADTTTP